MLEKKAPLFGWIIKFSLDRVWRSKVWWVMVGGRNFILSDLKTKTANLMCSPVVMWQPLQLAANTFYFPQTFCFSFSSQLFYFFSPILPTSFCGAFPLGIAVDSVLPGEGKPGRLGHEGGSPARAGAWSVGSGGVPQRKWHKLCNTLGHATGPKELGRRYLPPNAFLTKQFFILLL